MPCTADQPRRGKQAGNNSSENELKPPLSCWRCARCVQVEVALGSTTELGSSLQRLGGKVAAASEAAASAAAAAHCLEQSQTELQQEVRSAELASGLVCQA